MMGRRRAALVIATGAALGVALSGCESLSDPSLAAVKVVDGDLVVVICRTTQVRELSLKRRYDNERIELWLARRDVRVRAGQELTVSGLPELFDETDFGPTDLPPTSQLTLLVQAQPKADNIAVVFDADLLSPDAWLRPDDSLNEEPCLAE